MPAPYFIVPFATGGDQLPDGVPVTLQPDGSISYTLGWGPDYELDDTQPGYKPVGRREMNSMFNAVTAAVGEIQQFGFPLWRVEAAPYPINAIVRDGTTVWRSTVINNSTTPGTLDANWVDMNAGVPDASTSTKGVVALATSAEAVAGTNSTKAVTPAALKAAISALSDPWASQPIGVPIPLYFDGDAQIPPTNNAAYRYIKLTSGDPYNVGVVTNETLTGIAPLIIASSTILLAGSPLNGLVVSMINSERRFLRAGSPRVVEQDQLQNIVGGVDDDSLHGAGGTGGFTGAFARGQAANTRASAAGVTGYSWSFDASRVARAGNETRSKNVGVTYFMRIK